MRQALSASALCAVLLIGGCGGDDGAADRSTATSSSTESTARPVKARGERPPTERAKPIVIRVGGRTFRRAEPQIDLPRGGPPTDLIVEDLIEGTGARAGDGDVLTVEYVGIYYDDGGSFTNSWERSKPFSFELGGHEPFINPGWEKGLKGMRVGERRKLIVPPRYLYRGGAPPGSELDTIVYVVDLVRLD
jgi:peptidylprolyl isomerase